MSQSGLSSTSSGSNGFYKKATLTTTDATTTTIVAISLTSGTVVAVDGYVAAGLSDESTGFTARLFAGARRSSGGTSALISTAIVDELEDMTGSPTVTVDVDSNTVRIRATGVSATTIEWSLFYTVFVK